MIDLIEFKRTMEAADTVLQHLKKHVLPAYPRHYELLYTYVTGINPELNRAIDELLRAHSRLPLEEISSIFDKYLARDHLGQKIDEIGDQFSGRIDDTIVLLSETTDATHGFNAILLESRKRLSQASGTAEIDAIVGHLTDATERVQTGNLRLAQQLIDARDHIADLQKTLEAVRFECATDGLTTLANRRHFDLSLQRAVRQSEASGQTFSLLMIDIDHFKQFNDTYGHQTGDQVLRLVAQSLKQTVKGQDIACRYGGEEFAIILPNTRLDQAAVVGEQVRNAVVMKELVKRSTGEHLGRITVSVGVAAWRPGDLPADVLTRSDRALYAAKHSGRNAVRRETDPDVGSDGVI